MAQGENQGTESPTAGERLTVTFAAVGTGGVGIAYAPERSLAVEVPGVLAGEQVEVELLWVRPLRRRLRRTWLAWLQRAPALAATAASPRYFGWGRLLQVLTPASTRQTPLCAHFDRCGGCAWQHQQYDAQLERKRQQVVAALAQGLPHTLALSPLGEGLEQLVAPTLGSPRQWGYRNKLELTFDRDANLGFHAPGRYWDIVPAPACRIGSEEMVAAARTVSLWAKEKGLPGYDQQHNTGFLRHVVVRQAQATGQLMVALDTYPTATGQFPDASGLSQRLKAAAPHLTSLLWLSNPSPADVVRAAGGQLSVLYGRPYIVERLGGLWFQIELPTFFQINTEQAETLIRLARAAADLTATDLLFDLYCGVGTFSLSLAHSCRQVVGIELVEAAVAAARANAERNGIANVSFLAGETRRVWEKAVAEFGPPDVVLLDPPRAGAGAQVVAQIGRAQPRRVVYVSCNPVSLARDLAGLLPCGYRLVRVQPVDLFPHTDHVECVVLMTRV